MKKFLTAACATALSLSFAIAAVAPVQAAPIAVPLIKAEASSDVVQVRDRHFRRYNGNRYYNRGRHYNNNYYRRHRHNDGAAAAAIIGGALITGAIINSQQPRYVERRVYRSGNSHVEWCYNRYRSYRAWDNTFQPYNGPRQTCYSPY